jgi:16S rRNA G966 N2-methylase RsmD
MGILEKNLAKAGQPGVAEYLLQDALKGLNQLSRQGKSFDIVFFDPPYSSDLYATVPEALSRLSLLSDGGLLVAECSSRSPLAERYDTLVRIDRRVYGDTALELFIRETP